MTRLPPAALSGPLRLSACLAAATLLAGCASQPAPEAGGGRREATPTATPDPVDSARRAQVRLELATAYFTQRQYDTALEEIRRSLAANPQYGPAYNLRGLVRAALGDDAGAEESFRQALQINPRDVDTLQNYGWFLCQRQRYEGAIAQFNQAIAQPQYRDAARTYAARGLCQARAGQWTEAEASLMRSYELDPSNHGTALNLADVLLRRGELTRARFYIGRVNAAPDAANAQTLWLAARIEHKLGNTAAAREYGERIRARFPQSPELVLYDRGRFDE